MKISISIFLLLLSCSPYMDQRSQNTTIEFTAEEYDFGRLILDKEASCRFDFKNSGTSPLIIQNVTTSCGCTVPDWQEKPLKAGENGSITVHYDTSLPGVFQKTISVYYNGNDSPIILIIKGVVQEDNDLVVHS